MFEEPWRLSEDYQHNDYILVTFWGTEYFKNPAGNEVPFGSEVSWEIFRQMSPEEIVSVSSALAFSFALLIIIAFFILLLIFTCGSLLPVWMFINSMQLILHVPLIRIKLPGNAHHFLLEHLHILNFHKLSETLGLSDLVE